MPNFSPNPRAREITQKAVLAYKEAGLDVVGQTPFWLSISNDPGKAVFWRDGLVSVGVDLRTALRIVANLEAVKRSW